MSPLPKPSVDTGMGLERLAADPAGGAQQLRDRSVPAPDQGRRLTGAEDRQDKSLKVIADHIRSCAFLIVDGVCRPTKGAVTCCGASSAAPFAMATSSAARTVLQQDGRAAGQK
jgi:hypothetical protein